MASEHSAEPFSVASEQSVRDNIERIDLLFGKTSDGRLELALGASNDRFDGYSDGVGKSLPRGFTDKVSWIFGIYQHGDGSCLRHQFVEHFQLL